LYLCGTGATLIGATPLGPGGGVIAALICLGAYEYDRNELEKKVENCKTTGEWENSIWE
jgi:hypothetical protein